MGIYLPNMKMPEDSDMIVIYSDGTARKYLSYTRVIINETKAVPVPTHGRLGDLDALYEVVKKRTRNWAGGWSDIKCVLTGNDIKNAPTIVPAEENN